MSVVVRRGFPHGWIVTIVLALALGACGSSGGNKTAGGQAAVRGGYKIGVPYTIRGVKYYPREDFEYDKTGLASWYGDPFHGRKTASGEIYNKWAMTAAHKTLQMPSLVEVTNLENGRKLILRINDRGPFVSGRIIDLSRGAARKLGVEKTGVAKVRVRILKKQSKRLKQLALANRGPKAVTAAAPSPPPTAQAVARPAVPAVSGAPTALTAPPVAEQTAVRATPIKAARPHSIASRSLAPQPAVRSAPPPAAAVAPPRPPLAAAPPPVVAAPKPTAAAPPVAGNGSIFIQAGAFRSAGNAQRLRDTLASIGPARVVPAEVGGQRYYRVRLGPVASIEQGNRLLARIVSAGYPKARMIVRD